MSKQLVCGDLVLVWVPIPVHDAYTYCVPQDMILQVGSIVLVPLAGRQLTGVVVGRSENSSTKNIKNILSTYDVEPLSEVFLDFIKFVAHYTLTPPGLIMQIVLRGLPKTNENIVSKAWQLTADYESKNIKMTEGRQKVIDLFKIRSLWDKKLLAKKAEVSSALLQQLQKKNVIELVDAPFVEEEILDFTPKNYLLYPEQQQAAMQLQQAVKTYQSKVFLLEGVTGSGKTEVYFSAVEQALRQGQQILILMPEISLTQQFLSRFVERFGFYPLQWHSSMSTAQREKVWKFAQNGQLRLVVGVRSAVFLPFKNLGLLVVDEEHDTSYKQEERVFYNARDMAVMRGHMFKFPVVLSSATPSIETQVNVLKGKYEKISLLQRVSQAKMPLLQAVDLYKNPPAKGEFLSPVLLQAMQDTLDKGEQSLLFLNRRGYAPLTLCRSCGHKFQCLHCDTWLVQHRYKQILLCHHCGYQIALPNHCPECQSENQLVGCGPGVERIGEEVKLHFPDARILVLSTDLQGHMKQIKKDLDKITQGEVDIVIGTQLIAKGHHFPLMSLVGVVDTDAGLTNQDLRASERSFQAVLQVTGRAGRTGLESRGLLQTWYPEHPVIKSLISGSVEEFYRQEISVRQQDALPPFGRLIALIIAGKDKKSAQDYAQKLRQQTNIHYENVVILGPAEAPLGFLRDHYRFRLLFHAKTPIKLQPLIKEMIQKAGKSPAQVQLQIDVDPFSFL